jgi:acyl-CoA synthetase (AMP-forming)/AMP-acid ligase II
MMVGYLDADGEPRVDTGPDGIGPRVATSADDEGADGEAADRAAHVPRFDGTWLLTTDLAELVPGEPDGGPDDGPPGGSPPPGIVLLGRSGDMIIRGSTNIYPGLYEPGLAAHPAVDQAALVGVPDDFGDERVVAVIVPRAEERSGPGPAAPTGSRSDRLPGSRSDRLPEIAAALRTHIDHAARPDALVLMPALPTSGRSAKLDRPALRRIVAGLLREVPTTRVGAGASAISVYSEPDTAEG